MVTKRATTKRTYGAQLLIMMIFTAASLHAGDYAADFTRIGVGARPLAMGGAYTAVANDASGSYWNPAGGSARSALGLQIEHVPMFDGLAQYNTASAWLAFNPQTAVSLTWIRLSVDDIPRYGELGGNRYDRFTTGANRSDGEPLGYFTDQEDAFMLSFRRRMIFDLAIGSGFAPTMVPTEISFGVTGKYIHQKLDTYAGSGQGVDAGVLLRFMPNWQDEPEPATWIGFGAAVRDLSRTQISWNTDSRHQDEAGRSLQAGAAASWLYAPLRLRLTAAYDRLMWSEEGHAAGGEVTLFNTISLRGGYYRENLTAGAGLNLAGFSLDYAFVGSDLGNSHRITGSFGW